MRSSIWLLLAAIVAVIAQQSVIPLYEPGLEFWQVYLVGDTVSLAWSAQKGKGLRDIWIAPHNLNELPFRRMLFSRVDMESSGRREWTIGGIPADVLKGTDAYQVRYAPANPQGETKFDEKADSLVTVGFVIREGSTGADKVTTKSTTETAAKSTSTSASTSTATSTGTQSSPVPAGSSTVSPGAGGGDDADKGNQQTGDKQQSGDQQQQASQTIQLSTGALIGIILAPVLTCFAIVGALIWFFIIRKRGNPNGSDNSSASGEGMLMAGNHGDMPPNYNVAGRPWSEQKVHVEIGTSPEAAELPGSRRAVEMQG